VPLRLGDEPGRNVDRRPEVVALPVQNRARVRAAAHRREGGLVGRPAVDLDDAEDGGARIGEDEHERVADLLHDPPLAAAAGFADDLGESLEHPGRALVPHRHGERREARQIDERDRRGELPGHLRRLGEARILLHVNHGVLPHGAGEPLAVEVEDGRLDQR
jgi:hypothetical protein